MIDLRSDTVTKPTREMLEFMMAASVGDMVFDEDPMVNELEEMAAGLFGMEEAIYCPSGTMTNQIAIKAHTKPGDEVICSRMAHIYQFEGGGVAFNSGASVALIDSENGTFTADDVKGFINNPNDCHKAFTRLVEIENTMNRGAGACWNFEELKKIRELCSRYGLGYHLDGARLFNAMISDGQETGRIRSSFRFNLNMSFQGTGSSGGFASAGQQGTDQAGQANTKSIWRCHAAGRVYGCCRNLRA